MIKTVRWVALVLIIGLAALFLTACGSESSNDSTSSTTEDANKAFDPEKYLYTTYKKLPDGRTVLCVAYAAGYAGGLDCDFDTAK